MAINPKFADFAPQFRNKRRSTNFERRIQNPTNSISNPDGTTSTHRMMSFEADGKYYAAPTIVEKAGKLVELSEDEAIRYALSTGEVKEFDTDSAARNYAEGGYKVGTPMDPNITPKRGVENPLDILNQQKDFDASTLQPGLQSTFNKKRYDAGDSNVDISSNLSADVVSPQEGSQVARVRSYGNDAIRKEQQRLFDSGAFDPNVTQAQAVDGIAGPMTKQAGVRSLMDNAINTVDYTGIERPGDTEVEYNELDITAAGSGSTVDSGTPVTAKTSKLGQLGESLSSATSNVNWGQVGIQGAQMAASVIDNIQQAKLNEQMLAEGVPDPTYLKNVSLNKDVDISSQLASTSDQAREYEELVLANTSDSSSALNKIRASKIASERGKSDLYSDKFNQERGLINQELAMNLDVTRENTRRLDESRMNAFDLKQQYFKNKGANIANLSADLVAGVDRYNQTRYQDEILDLERERYEGGSEVDINTASDEDLKRRLKTSTGRTRAKIENELRKNRGVKF